MTSFTATADQSRVSRAGKTFDEWTQKRLRRAQLSFIYYAILLPEISIVEFGDTGMSYLRSKVLRLPDVNF